MCLQNCKKLGLQFCTVYKTIRTTNKVPRMTVICLASMMPAGHHRMIPSIQSQSGISQMLFTAHCHYVWSARGSISDILWWLSRQGLGVVASIQLSDLMMVRCILCIIWSPWHLSEHCAESMGYAETFKENYVHNTFLRPVSWKQ